LGVKLFGGQLAIPGNIIVRQRGTTWFAGTGVGMGVDHTLFAMVEGHVTFKKGFKGRTFISVLPSAEAAE
jgi:large subunit ribosomal protein L27